jgi:hypothetical protein
MFTIIVDTKSFISGKFSRISVLFVTWRGLLCCSYLALSPGQGFKIITLEPPKSFFKCYNLKYSADKKFQFSAEKLSASSSS